jgi:hypothetical protein
MKRPVQFRSALMAGHVGSLCYERLESGGKLLARGTFPHAPVSYGRGCPGRSSRAGGWSQTPTSSGDAGSPGEPGPAGGSKKLSLERASSGGFDGRAGPTASGPRREASSACRASGISALLAPCKDAWGFNGATLSRCSSFLISDDLFTRPRCAMHDQVNLVFTESGGAQFVYGLLGLRLDFKNAYHGGTVIICYCHEFFLSQGGCRATPGHSTYLFPFTPPYHSISADQRGATYSLALVSVS